MNYTGKSYDRQYIKLVERVLEEGVRDENPRTVYEDGETAYSYRVFGHSFTLRPTDIPLLLTKRVGLKDSVIELVEWMWQLRSNDVGILQELGCNVWNQWQDENGTIGEAYGFMLNKKVDGTDRNQVDNLIHNLKNNPDSRRHIVSLWGIENGHKMELKPCVYESQWVVLDGYLHVAVNSRSTDVALGLPYNIAQYWVLHKLIANEVGLKAGYMKFNMSIPHIYDRHIEELKAQVNHYYFFKDEISTKPLSIDLDMTNGFYGFSHRDINYDEYKKMKLPKRRFEVAE